MKHSLGSLLVLISISLTACTGMGGSTDQRGQLAVSTSSTQGNANRGSMEYAQAECGRQGKQVKILSYDSNYRNDSNMQSEAAGNDVKVSLRFECV